MKVDFIWIENYKSLHSKSKLKIEPSVTAIIGKNESGKSNLIDILGAISLKKGLSANNYLKTPQGLTDAKLSVKVETSFSDIEIAKLKLELNQQKSCFNISEAHSPFHVSISGGIKAYFTNKEFNSNIEIIETIIIETFKKITDATIKKNIQDRVNYLKNSSDYIIPEYSNNLAYISKQINKHLSNEEKKQIDASILYLEKFYSEIYDLLPIFYKYTEVPMLNQYTINPKFLEEESEELTSLNKFLKAAKCTIEDLRTACLDNSLDGWGMDAQDRIRNGIKENIEEGFNLFYQQEDKVEIKVDFNRNMFLIYIRTSKGSNISISERSQGLKWYLNMYIDILENNLELENTVFLIDEPGTHLHVDAQKKVLELFDNFATENNQIVYTTHSPFMLNENRLDRIRVIQKSQEGHSEILTSVLSERLIGQSKSEALSPLVNALGMKMHQNIGMSDDIMNVITEGYSDVMYLDTMAKNLGIENMKFIASIGASQSVHLAKILWGWGYPYKILFDSDKAGHDAKKSIMKYFGYQEGEVEGINFKSEHIVMISDVLTTEDKDVKTIESLIEEEDYKKFSNEFSEIKVQTDSNMKMIFAKTFADKVTAAEVTLCFETVNNFKRLFKKINE